MQAESHKTHLVCQYCYSLRCATSRGSKYTVYEMILRLIFKVCIILVDWNNIKIALLIVCGQHHKIGVIFSYGSLFKWLTTPDLLLMIVVQYNLSNLYDITLTLDRFREPGHWNFKPFRAQWRNWVPNGHDRMRKRKCVNFG